jgi:hypothetical protein
MGLPTDLQLVLEMALEVILGNGLCRGRRWVFGLRKEWIPRAKKRGF